MNIILMALFLFILGCSQDNDVIVKDAPFYVPSEEGGQWVAKVGNRTISNAELSHLLAFYHAKPGELSKRDVDTALDQLVQEELYFQKAMELGYDQTPEYRTKVRRLLANAFLNETKLERYKNLVVTDSDVKAYYEYNIKQYSSPKMLRAAVFKYSVDNTLANKSEALEKIKISVSELPIESGFGKYSEYSDHERSKNKGGLLSWYAADKAPYDAPKDVWELAGKLDLGQVSEPIEVNGDFYLLRKIDERVEKIRPIETEKVSIKQELIRKKKAQIDAAFQKNIKAGKTLEINTLALPNIEPEQSLSTPPSFPLGK